MNIDATPAPRRGISALARKISGGLIALTLAVSGLLALSAPANAATQGPGFGRFDNTVGWMGGYIAPDGSIVYCIEPGVSTPSGATQDGGIQTTITSEGYGGHTTTLSGDTLARVNYLVSAHGQTTDNRTASAVHFAVQYIANPEAMFNSASWGGSHDLHGFVNWKLFSSVGSAETAAIADLAQVYINEAMTVTAGSTATDVTGSLVFAVDGNNDYVGTVTPTFSAQVGTGTITLTNNGVFADTGTDTLAGAQGGTAYAITGVPPVDDAGDPLPYRISGTAHFDVGSSGWLPAAHLWETPGQQRTVGPGGEAVTSIDIAGEDPAERSVQFEPVVTTSAPRFVAEGESFTDVVTASLGSGQPWAQNSSGAYAPIVARGTLYGALDAEPVESAVAPADAPVAGTAEVTLNGAGEYTVETDFTSQEPGYYTWVWVIDTADQRESVQRLLPDGYRWSDAYGQRVETSITPPRVTTKAQPSTALGGEISDTAIVEGVVPNDTTLTFEAYKVPTDADGNIDYPEGFTPSDEEGANNLTWVCEEEPVFVSEDPIVVTNTGEYQSEAFTPTEYGKYLWVETLLVEGTEVYRGECGVRLETSFVLDVTTKAQERGKAGETATDTAIIDGFIPDGATITFDAYRVAEDAPQAPTEVCTESTLIGSTEPVEIAGGMHDGTEIVSAPVKLPDQIANYKVYWIESIHDELGNVIAEGECGLPEETTTVEGSHATLAFTGGESSTALWVGGAALMSLIAGLGVAAIRRRHGQREEALLVV